MKKTKVKFLGKQNDNFKLKFPYLKVPIIVNEYYYNKLKNSEEYKFI
ncbi:hypothetical protein [uncultured Tenacibaculum sp.]|nr:hypothetical protein [uncultured Tenacibaculum sp.]